MNEMKMESAYWVSIPVQLLEDESLPHAALRLYGIIGSLTYSRGYCYASNETLAGKMHSTVRTVQNNLAVLRERGYIAVQDAEGQRRIYQADLKNREEETCTKGVKKTSYHEENFAEGCKKFRETHEKNFTQERIKEKEEREDTKKQQEDKLEFGRRGLVMLTKQEYERLCTDAVSTQAVQDAVTALEAYIANGKGRKYKDHYLTLLNWLRRDHKLKEQQDGRKDEFW